MKKTLPLAMLLAIGCASYPPATVKNGVYENHQYQFRADVPEGWISSSDIPDQFKKMLPKNTKQIFVNKDGGILAVTCDKSILDMDLLTIDRDIYEKAVAENLEKQKAEMLKQSDVVSFEYTVRSDTSCSPCDMGDISIAMENGTHMIRKELYHRCHGDDTCITGIVLISPEKNLESNLAEMKKLQLSIRPFQ